MDSGASAVPDQAGSETPNPGSSLAVEQGCVCPRLENNGGMLAPFPPNAWYIDAECPIHGTGRTSEDLDVREVRVLEEIPLDKHRRQ